MKSNENEQEKERKGKEKEEMPCKGSSGVVELLTYI